MAVASVGSEATPDLEAGEEEEEYPLLVDYCGLCTMPPEVGRWKGMVR